jgi:hypothetical protein
MAGYIGPVPTPQATQSRDYFTATAGQTSFPTSGYTPGYLDVYLNGVHLQDSDFTATNGSDVVLNDPCAADDVVLVVAWSTFEATNVDYSNVQNKPTTLSGYGITDAATSTQGATADSAVQPGDLATVATSGAYSDLTGTPTAVSAFTNNAGYATTSYVDTAESDAVATANAYTDTEIGNISVTPAGVSGQTNTSTGFFALPKGTTAQRPSSPQNGYTRYNTTLSYVEYYSSGSWFPVYQNPNTIVLEYLAVAGGGCGGSSNNGSGKNGGGGGGAGGAVNGEADVSLNGSFTVSVVIGAGGTGATGSGYQSIGRGSNTILSNALSATLVGGGYGGNDESNTAPVSGGSGGGGGASVQELGASGTAGQGNRGGNASSGGGGGGGGKGSAGANGVNQTGGNGGTGITWEDGVSYAGGGGGGGDNGGSGNDGGGNGAGHSADGQSAPANRGGGGGAAGASGDNYSGGNGGSGVVIFRYESSSALFTGGAITSSGGYQYHKFTSSGTLNKL